MTDTVRVSFWVPVLTVSEANVRDHWGKRAKRAKQQQQIVGWFLVSAIGLPAKRAPLRGRVRLTRTSKGALDTDNLAVSLKAIRDAIAMHLATHDGPTGPLTWEYDQESGRPGVRIELEATWSG